jgi:hypothetical protein
VKSVRLHRVKASSSPPPPPHIPPNASSWWSTSNGTDVVRDTMGLNNMIQKIKIFVPIIINSG